MSEGRLSDMDAQEAIFARGMHIPPEQVNPWETTEWDTILLFQK